jgi:UDP-N-acetylglucosamine--N-acetylmuramyl-(pentapeptide) pyrophosphoryl-undecaprenol N-acetylglucosamine transferase
MTSLTTQHVLFAGGKSGGHLFPALAVAEELLGRGWTVGFLGTESGLESRVVRSRRLPFYAVDAEPVVGRGLLARTRALLVLARSALVARRLVRRLDAGVVFGTGGFVSVPGVLGGWLARVRVFLFEPNAQPGAANRFLSRLAQHAAVAFESAARELHCASTLTGVPVRSEFFAPRPAPTAPPMRILVLGGSQGARHLNEVVPEALSAIAGEVGGLEVVHQSGTRERDATAARYAELRERALFAQVVAFADDVAGLMAASHLVISRAGAITLAEIGAAGRPSVLVPLPLAGHHQAANAAAFESAGAAMVVADAALDDMSLAARLRELLLVPARLEAMGAAARSLARPDAAARIADRLEALVAGSPAERGVAS